MGASERAGMNSRMESIIPSSMSCFTNQRNTLNLCTEMHFPSRKHSMERTCKIKFVSCKLYECTEHFVLCGESKCWNETFAVISFSHIKIPWNNAYISRFHNSLQCDIFNPQDNALRVSYNRGKVIFTAKLVRGQDNRIFQRSFVLWKGTVINLLGEWVQP